MKKDLKKILMATVVTTNSEREDELNPDLSSSTSDCLLETCKLSTRYRYKLGLS